MTRVALGGLILLLSPAGVCRAQPVFQQTNLVSSVPGLAAVTDANLKNPWGVSFAPNGPFSVSNQATGNATQYDGSGNPQATVITVLPSSTSPPGTLGSPTGQVFNPTTDFRLPPVTGSPATFLFATRDGTIAAWNGGPNALRQVDLGTLASLTGLTMGNNGTGNFLFAADHLTNSIRTFNGSFAATGGFTFTDPGAPAGFAPYNVQNLGGTVFVTYANDATGGGIVDAFNLSGGFVRRISSNGPGGNLDRPWGLAIAPAGFGPFGGALLVGNEGNGRISAFDVLTGQFLGQLADASGTPIANPGLWALTFGNGGTGGDPNTLFFTAGIQNQTAGLFGSIRPVPEPSGLALLLMAVGGTMIRSARRCGLARAGS